MKIFVIFLFFGVFVVYVLVFEMFFYKVVFKFLDEWYDERMV